MSEIWKDLNTGKLYESSNGNSISDEQNTVWTEIVDTSVTEEQHRDLELLRSNNKLVKMKVTLLDNNYQEVANLVGKVVNADYSFDADSDIRRVCALTLSMDAKDQVQTDFKRTWNKRMVELSCGLYSHSDGEFVWYKLGRMLMRDGSTTTDGSTQEVKLSLVDLMGYLTEARGSQIGYTLIIPSGSNVRSAIISIISNYTPFARYEIPTFPDTIPYDIEIGVGKYPYEALKEILNLFPTYEMYYSTNGVFTVREIPTKISDPVDIGKEIIDDVLISESLSANFSDVKNTTEIWGRELDAEYYASAVSTSDDTYVATISGITEYKNLGTYGFTPSSDSIEGQKFQINDLDAVSIYTQAGDGTFTPIEEGTIREDVPCVLQYIESKFVYQGELHIHVILQEITELPSITVRESYKQDNECKDVRWLVNPDSPFAATLDPSTGRIVGEIKQVLTGGEYNNIYTTQLAFERAYYENWIRTRLQDTVNADMILIPWMDLNDKIEFTSIDDGQVGTWMVRSITYDFSRWTMSVKLSRFSAYYPFDPD